MYACEHLAVVNTDCHVFLYIMCSGDMYESQIYKILTLDLHFIRLALFQEG
jgi:hypothetical protein